MADVVASYIACTLGVIIEPSETHAVNIWTLACLYLLTIWSSAGERAAVVGVPLGRSVSVCQGLTGADGGSGPVGRYRIFCRAPIRSPVAGWVAKNPPPLDPSCC